MSDNPATDKTKTDLENTVAWFLSAKMSGAGVSIATQKFLTNDNRLVYLTHCTLADPSVAKVKVQVFERVDGGVHETGYQLYADHRLEKYQNAMIFGTAPSGPDVSGLNVNEDEAAKVLALVTALQTSARALV